MLQSSGQIQKPDKVEQDIGGLNNVHHEAYTDRSQGVG